ncbi:MULTISPECIES: DUF2607 family protein [unclassified Vibrio]|uniref:DUF2607 family protein n=1 Tax=unclassified Vibrio TaxID=2614977 RepID=UPI00210ADBE4|nr:MULTISPECIES: DUF2607 family protein [unclassified Vibrio]
MNLFSRTAKRTLLILSLFMLPLSLNISSIVHELEMGEEVHAQHHCGIYDAVQSAVHSSSFPITTKTQAPTYQKLTRFAVSLSLFELPRTRSPPLA